MEGRWVAQHLQLALQDKSVPPTPHPPPYKDPLQIEVVIRSLPQAGWC